LIIKKEELDTAIDIIEGAINDFLAGDIPDEILRIAKGW